MNGRMPENDDIIDETVVRVSPDLTGFRRKLVKDLKTETVGVSAKVKAVAELRGFRTDLRNQLRAVDIGYKVKVEADTRHLHRSIRDAVRKAQITLSAADDTVKIKLDVDEGSALAAAQKASRLHQQVRNRVDQEEKAWDQAHRYDRYNRALTWQQHMDALHEQANNIELARRKQHDDRMTRLAEAAERERQRRLTRIKKFTNRDTYGPKIIDLGGAGVRPMNALLGVVAAMTPALFAMGASALQASTAVAALGAAGIGAAAGITAVTLGFGRIGEALALRAQIRKADIRETAKAASAARGEGAYADAVRNAAESVENARSSVRDANRGLATSERNLADALRDAREARAGITLAYHEAARAVRELREEVSDLALEEADAALSVEEARAAQAAVNRNYFATDLERRKAAMDTAKAIERVSDLQRERLEKTQALQKREREGLNRSPEVKDARERAAEARDRLTDQRSAVAGDRDRVADARRQLQRAQADLGRARRNVGAATTAADTTSASDPAAAELAELRRKMSPAARAMDEWLEKHRSSFEGLRKDMEAAVLPGFLSFLKSITSRGRDGASTLSIMAGNAGRLGGIIGDTVAKLGEASETPWFRKSLKRINEENEKSFRLLGDAAVKLLGPLMRIAETSAPLFTKFSESMLDFATWIDKVLTTKRLEKWFADAATSMGRWVDLGKAIIRFVMPIFTNALPAGGTLVERLTAFVTQLGDWSNSAKGQAALSKFFDKFANLKYGDISQMLAQLTLLIGAFKLSRMAARHPFMTLFAVLATVDIDKTQKLLGYLTNFAVDTLGWIDRNKEAATTLLAIFAGAGAAGKVLDVGIRLPGIDNLKGFLTGKFKWLDTMMGGSKTATMTVHAAVVNILGGGKGMPGTPVPTGAPPGVVGAPGAPGAKPGAPGLNGPLGFPVVANPVITEDANGNPFRAPTPAERDAAKSRDTWLDKVKRWMNVGGGDDKQDPQSAAAITARAKARRIEALSYDVVNSRVKLNNDKLTSNTLATRTTRVELDKYLERRKASVDLAYKEVLANEGLTAAQKFLSDQNIATRDTLISLLTQTGMNADEAKDYALQVYGVGSQQDIARVAEEKNRVALEATRKQSVLTRDEANRYAQSLKVLSDNADKATGVRKLTVKVDGETQVFKSLLGLAAYQEVLRTGTPATESNLRKIRDQITNKNTFATGGPVRGPGTATSDSIPALLSNGEYVQPTDVVSHYGNRAMEAIREKRVPKWMLEPAMFAAGGPVNFPFPVNVSKTKIPTMAATTPGGGSLGGGSIASMVSTLKAADHSFDVYSGFRNSRTLSGQRSRHALGKAIDITPKRSIADWIYAKAAQNSYELITPWRDRMLYKGRPHKFSPAVERQHGVGSAGNDHIHWSVYAKGGPVAPPTGLVARRFDNGGKLPPGVSLAVNGTREPETVRTGAQERALGNGRIDKRDLALLAAYMIDAISRMHIKMDGRKVAETIRGYDYLPRGF